MKKKYHIIYCTVNNLNGKAYIGVHSTDNLEDGYLGSGVLIKKAIKKYGKENFTTTILEYHKDKKTAHKREAYIVDEEFIGFDWNYNVTIGGKVLYHTPEIRKKISESLKGKYVGENNPRYGKEFSKAHRENIRKSKLGELNHRYGTTLTEEHKKRISEANTGKIKSEETKKKLSDANIGKKLSKETKKKISDFRTGKPRSEETKEKISNSLKGIPKDGIALIHIDSGKEFRSFREAAMYLDLNYITVIKRFKNNSKLNKLNKIKI